MRVSCPTEVLHLSPDSVAINTRQNGFFLKDLLQKKFRKKPNFRGDGWFSFFVLSCNLLVRFGIKRLNRDLFQMGRNGQAFHSQGTLGAKQNLCSNISQEIV